MNRRKLCMQQIMIRDVEEIKQLKMRKLSKIPKMTTAIFRIKVVSGDHESIISYIGSFHLQYEAKFVQARIKTM